MATITIHLSAHAIHRFHERVRPALSRAAAEDELAALLTLAEITEQPPAWLAMTARQEADAYAIVGDVVLPLVAIAGRDEMFVAKTVIPRGGISERARERRNEHRRARRRFPRRTPHWR